MFSSHCNKCLFLFLFLCPISIKAQDTLVYPTDSSFIEIGPYCRIYADEKDMLDFEQIKNLPDSHFQQSPSGNLSFGSTKASMWAKFSVKNQSNEPLYLTFWGWGILYLDIYTLNEKGELMVRQTGTKRPFMSRDLKRGHIAVNIGKSPKVVYIKLKSTWQLNTHVSLSALKPLNNVYYGRDTFNGVCMGILLAMALYNLFLFFSVWERLYLYYFVYIILALVAISEMNSTYRFFIGWGEGVGLRELMLFTGIIFSMRFLDTRSTMPWGHKLLAGISVSLFICIVLSLFNQHIFYQKIYTITALLTVFSVPVLSYTAYRRGNKSALFYFIAWSFLVVSGFFTILISIGMIPFTFWTNSVFTIGTCLEAILMAFALAYRLKTYRDDSKAAQQLAIQRLQENERLVKEQNKLLEEKVQERTLALEQSLQNLKSTQALLIQSEKMASLGELTAGIAHEIQNPLNFVNNFSEVSSELIDDMQEELTKVDIEEAKAISNDLKQNLEKITHHGQRASNIVKGMLLHSRSSTGQQELTDINALCDEYIRLSYHGLRAKDKSFNTHFETDFDETIPKINIVPQDLGRVILNLVNNAFYAVNDRRKKNEVGYVPKVDISTKMINSKIEILVKDNGNGIPQIIIEKIFQPFFTTKPTGQGTGLGLSLSYDIVKAHGGELIVKSKENEGSDFIIHLPII